MIKKILILTFFFQWSFSASILELASKVMQKGEYKKAEVLLKKALKMGESEIFVKYNLAYIYFQEGKVAKSIDFYKEVIKLSPRFINAYHNLSRIYYRLEDYQSSLETVKQSIKMDSEYADSYLLLGDLYNQIGAYDLAQKSYENGIKVNPTMEDSYFALIDLYILLSDYDKALSIVYDSENKMGSKSNNMGKQEAFLLLKTGNYLKASAVYERMIELGDYGENREELYDLYRSLVDIYEEANINFMKINTLKKMLFLFPKKDDIFDRLNSIYESENRLEDVVDVYDDFFKTNKLVAYKVIRNLFYEAYNNDNKVLMDRILEFYDKYKLNDSLYRTVRFNN